MRTIAIGTFLASTAVTGVSLALIQAFAVQQAAWTLILGVPVMLVSAGVAASPHHASLDRQMRENRTHLSLSRQQPRNGHRRPSAMRYSRSLDLRGLRR